jgi:hypothetical protein
MNSEYIKTEKVKGVWTYSITPEGQTFLNTHLDDEDAVYDLWEVQNLNGYNEDLIEMIVFVDSKKPKEFKEWLRSKYPDYFSRAID